MNITIDLDSGLIHETLIALRDRQHGLRIEISKYRDPILLEIVNCQLSRVVGAIAGLEDAVEGARIKGLPV